MGQTAVQDFYRSAHFVFRIGPGHFPSESDSGARSGMETDEEVALIPGDCDAGSVRRTRMNWAGPLRRELSQRAEQRALKHRLPYCLSYGRSPTVCFESYGDSGHSNFLPATTRRYSEIQN
jgi:hypothetical protein